MCAGLAGAYLMLLIIAGGASGVNTVIVKFTARCL